MCVCGCVEGGCGELRCGCGCVRRVSECWFLRLTCANTPQHMYPPSDTYVRHFSPSTHSRFGDLRLEMAFVLMGLWGVLGDERKEKFIISSMNDLLKMSLVRMPGAWDGRDVDCGWKLAWSRK